VRAKAAAFYERASAAGYRLQFDQRLWWLTRYGHALPEVEAHLPAATLRALQRVFVELHGSEDLLRAKTRGGMDADFLLGNWVVEYDERSHFTRARLATFVHYPRGTTLGYDTGEYSRLIEVHYARGERGFAHKKAAEFPGPGGRMRQRAYFDAFRDLAAPTLQSHPVLRVASPEEDAVVGLQRFEACLRQTGVQNSTLGP
jgi:hypothetical protein